MRYQTLNKTAHSLYNDLRQVIPGKLDYGAPFNTEGVHYNNSILILGLNHSSAQNGLDSILHHIPVGLRDHIGNHITQLIRENRWAYDTYFKKHYELFGSKKKNVLMFWQHPDYYQLLELIFNDQHGTLQKELTGNLDDYYLVFNDLVPIQEKKSKKIFIKTDNKKLLKKIKLYFDQLLLYHSPRLVVVANAKASKLILQFLQKAGSSENVSSMNYSIKGKKYPLVFSGQLSGGATDRFATTRLRREIETLLKWK